MAELVLTEVAVVAELLTFPAVAIVANLVSSIAAAEAMSAFTIVASAILVLVTAPEAMAGEVGWQVSEAMRVGGDEHRRDLDVLPTAGGAPQTFEEHEPAGTVQPGDQAADVGGADLSR